MPFQIQTSRFILREFQRDDACVLFDLNHDPQVLKYTGDVPFSSVKAASRFINSYESYHKSGYGRWIIESKNGNEVYGWCGLKYHEDEAYTDIGYRIFRNHWGKGIATETTMSCLKAAKEVFKLKKVVGRTSPLNKSSIRVLEKCGLKFWKTGECEGIDNALYYHILF